MGGGALVWRGVSQLSIDDAPLVVVQSPHAAGAVFPTAVLSNAAAARRAKRHAPFVVSVDGPLKQTRKQRSKDAEVQLPQTPASPPMDAAVDDDEISWVSHPSRHFQPSMRRIGAVAVASNGASASPTLADTRMTEQ